MSKTILTVDDSASIRQMVAMTLKSAGHQVLEAGRLAPGHVFNLGHGVIPSTDPDQLARLTAYVQESTAR